MANVSADFANIEIKTEINYGTGSHQQQSCSAQPCRNNEIHSEGPTSPIILWDIVTHMFPKVLSLRDVAAIFSCADNTNGEKISGQLCRSHINAHTDTSITEKSEASYSPLIKGGSLN